MKHLLYTPVFVLLVLFFFGCANNLNVSRIGEEQTPFQTIVVRVDDEDSDFAKDIEYRAVRDFCEQGVEAYAENTLLNKGINADTLQARLILSRNENAKLISISTNRVVWEGNVSIEKNLLFSSKDINRYLVDNNIIGKTASAKEMEDKQAGAAIWLFSALLFLVF